MKNVFLVGAAPPTIGGVSIHVDRLAGILCAEGVKVTVWDFYSRAAPDIDPTSYSIRRGPRLLLGLQLVFSSFVVRPRVVHLHISGARQVVQLFPLVLLLSRWTTVIATVHSGSFIKNFEERSSFVKSLATIIFKQFSAVICVNENIRRFLLSKCGCSKDRVVVIIPFINGSEKDDELTIVDRPKIMIASGYGTSLYSWEVYIKGCCAMADFEEFRFVFYGKYDAPYYREIIDECNLLLGRKAKIYNDLSPAAFLKVLNGSHVFVRPTLTDGDSVAVREALSMGKIVVASDAVARPPGCLLFETGSAESLITTLRKAVLNFENLPPGEGIDATGDLVTLYQRYI